MDRNEYMRKYYQARKSREPWWGHYVTAKSRCSCRKRNWFKRGIKFLLTIEQLKLIWDRDKAYSLKVPSLDRIDNDGNYTLENCRFIEISENSRQGNLGNTIRRGKYKTNVGKSALAMRRWRERKRGEL